MLVAAAARRGAARAGLDELGGRRRRAADPTTAFATGERPLDQGIERGGPIPEKRSGQRLSEAGRRSRDGVISCIFGMPVWIGELSI